MAESQWDEGRARPRCLATTRPLKGMGDAIQLLPRRRWYSHGRGRMTPSSRPTACPPLGFGSPPGLLVNWGGCSRGAGSASPNQRWYRVVPGVMWGPISLSRHEGGERGPGRVTMRASLLLPSRLAIGPVGRVDGGLFGWLNGELVGRVGGAGWSVVAKPLANSSIGWRGMMTKPMTLMRSQHILC